VPTSPEIRASTTLEIWSVRLNHQRSNMYILMNHWLATNTTGSCCLSKIVKRVVSHIIFTLHTLWSTGLRSDELGGQSVGGTKSGDSCSSSTTVSLARCDGQCLTERRKTRFQMPHGCHGVCFRSESVIPRSPMSANWNDASRTSGQIWITLLLNVLLASGNYSTAVH